MPPWHGLGGGARPRPRFSDTLSEGGRRAVRAPWIIAGNISSGDGRTRGKGNTRGKDKKVRGRTRGKGNTRGNTTATIVPAFLWHAAGDAAATPCTVHQGMKPLVPHRILAWRTDSPNQSGTP